MSFVPNLEACRCLLLIFDASFDILFTFFRDMQRKHLYQSVSFMVCVVRMSGLPYSLHFLREGVCSATWVVAMPTESGCYSNSATEAEINMFPKFNSNLKKRGSNPPKSMRLSIVNFD